MTRRFPFFSRSSSTGRSVSGPENEGLVGEFDRSLAITYYKRFRMEIELQGPRKIPTLPEECAWVPWEERLIDRHAETKFLCFRGEIDAYVFPSLGDRHGCQRLMREIRRKPGFLPSATWLIAGKSGFLGTVQGVIDNGSIGAIQNVGVVPEFRGQGFGRALLEHALVGFQEAGLRRAYLEVTAENTSAVQLYRSLGFHKAKTLYKAVAS